MSEQRKRRNWKRWTAVWLIVFSIYALSIGPANLAIAKTRSYPLARAVRVFYLPILVTCENWEPANKLLKWYVMLWVR